MVCVLSKTQNDSSMSRNAITVLIYCYYKLLDLTPQEVLFPHINYLQAKDFVMKGLTLMTKAELICKYN
jgi:hypothetical protein